MSKPRRSAANQGPDVRDISMVGTPPPAGKLAELRAAHARAMPA
ncbi:hypothetical protein AB0K15_38050 [Amycolatopsis sp. NPDC049253]